eukprot:Polyplicarium_translucidae@DN3079_c0_g1_i5.p1
MGLSDFDFGSRWTTEATETTAQIAAGFFNRLMQHQSVAVTSEEDPEVKRRRLTIPNIQFAIESFLGSSPIVKSGFSASLQQVKWYQRAESLAAQTIARHGIFFTSFAKHIGERYSIPTIEEKLQPPEASSPSAGSSFSEAVANEEPDETWLGFVILASFMES